MSQPGRRGLQELQAARCPGGHLQPLGPSPVGAHVFCNALGDSNIHCVLVTSVLLRAGPVSVSPMSCERCKAKPSPGSALRPMSSGAQTVGKTGPLFLSSLVPPPRFSWLLKAREEEGTLSFSSGWIPPLALQWAPPPTPCQADSQGETENRTEIQAGGTVGRSREKKVPDDDGKVEIITQTRQGGF